MEFVSILDKIDVAVKDAPRADFFTDFNLTRIIEEITHNWGEDVMPFYRYFPKDAESEAYRRKIYRDIRVPENFEGINKSYSLMQKKKFSKNNKDKARQPVAQHIWHVNEVYWYTRSVDYMDKCLSDKQLNSEGMRAFYEKLHEYATSKDFLYLYETSEKIQTELDGIRVKMLYENKRMVLLDEVENHPEAITESHLRELYSENTERVANPFAGDFDILGIEKDILFLVMRKHSDLFKAAATMYDRHLDYEKDFITRFYEEVSFYLSFVKFENDMKNQGYVMTLPTEKEDEKIHAEGLYDLALALVNQKRGKEVVSNNFYYDQNDLFFVLTGPNQGGKTTFARSLGQLVFFTKMGLPVPADSANLHYFSDILTHFSVEESVETGRGKLMEELVRLAPMMKSAKENAFIVINELFTTAANYDACIMGKKVLSHFIQNGCHGIYVTHLAELLESEERAVGLCAALDDKGFQTYKILREVMEYQNCATNQVNKYGLTYDELKKRLEERSVNA